MHIPTITPFTLIAWLIFGAIAAIYAKRRGKNPFLWFGLGAMLGVLGIFLLFFMPKKKKLQQTALVHPLPANEKLFWYYLDEENRQRGPFAFDVLKQARKEGRLSSQTFVWNQTLDKWEPFARFHFE